MINGSLLINKEIGLTSRQEVNNISHAFNEKKVGHIGTLDPFADGLLIINLGSSTKIAPFLEVMDKGYIATLKLGEKTDTGDLTGNVIETKEIPVLKKENIQDLLGKMVGEHEQIPPMYSAVKINGKQLYKYAREGKTLERKARLINIYDIKLLSFSSNLVVFYAKVSKGTHIRTLGEEIAEKLGTLGHLTKLTRVEVGPYKLEDSVSSENAKESNLISIEKMLAHIPTILVENELEKMALNGMHIRLACTHDVVLVKSKKEIIALYKREPNGVYSCLRGLR